MRRRLRCINRRCHPRHTSKSLSLFVNCCMFYEKQDIFALRCSQQKSRIVSQRSTKAKPCSWPAFVRGGLAPLVGSQSVGWIPTDFSYSRCIKDCISYTSYASSCTSLYQERRPNSKPGQPRFSVPECVFRPASRVLRESSPVQPQMSSS